MPKTVANTPEALHRLFEAAFNAHDADAVVGLYAPDAILRFGNDLLADPAAIRAAYRTLFELQPRMELTTVGVLRSGDLAQLRGQWIWQGRTPDGAVVRHEGRSVETVREHAGRGWLYVLDDPGGA